MFPICISDDLLNMCSEPFEFALQNKPNLHIITSFAYKGSNLNMRFIPSGENSGILPKRHNERQPGCGSHQGPLSQNTTALLCPHAVHISSRDRNTLPCFGFPSCALTLVQCSDIFIITSGCSETETLPEVPADAITVDLLVSTSILVAIAKILQENDIFMRFWGKLCYRK